MPFSGIAGHSKAIDAIKRILGSGRVAHAYLFTGPEGVGKRKVATAFIEALFCGRDEGCGECISCRKIASGNHPDIHALEPDGQFIKVDQVRDFQKSLAFKPYEAPRKACIIDGADRFNQSSGNSLLKTLEEPPGNALMILLASSPDAVLSTIRSRCQIIPFSGIPEEEIAAFLAQNGSDPGSARVAASLCAGSMAKALSLCSEEIMGDRSDIITRACNLSTNNMFELFAFGELFDKDREKTIQALELLTGFWRDMLHLASGSASVVNSDLLHLLQLETKRRSTEALMRGIEALGKTRQAILRNSNVRLSMDVLSMQLAL
ncbi:MAG: DNA polymerase III subunit delta' [Geobacteraceae bacterium]|nr:DNA polymerase III subunit delta' [Geobacteraceae bacterium]